MLSHQPSSLKRRLQIVEVVRRLGEARVDSLSQQFGVSTVTIRNDLNYLEKQGFLVRSFGKAIYHFARQMPVAPVINEDKTTRMVQEIALARAAAHLIEDGDTVLLGAGSIIRKMIPFLASRSHLSLFINELSIIPIIQQYVQCDIQLTGGAIVAGCDALVGPIAEKTIQLQTINKCFIEAQIWRNDGVIACHQAATARLYRAAVQHVHLSVAIALQPQYHAEGFPLCQSGNFDRLIVSKDFSESEHVLLDQLEVSIEVETAHAVVFKL